MDNSNSATDLKITHVDNKLEDFKRLVLGDISEIKSDVKKLLAPKWTVWFLAAGLFSGITGTMWKVAVQPIENDVTHLTSDLATEVATRRSDTVTKETAEERRNGVTRELSDLRADLKALDANKVSNADLAKAYIDFNIKRRSQ